MYYNESHSQVKEVRNTALRGQKKMYKNVLVVDYNMMYCIFLIVYV